MLHLSEVYLQPLLWRSGEINCRQRVGTQRQCWMYAEVEGDFNQSTNTFSSLALSTSGYNIFLVQSAVCLFHEVYHDGSQVVVSPCRSLTWPIQQLIREMAGCPSFLYHKRSPPPPPETLGLCADGVQGFLGPLSDDYTRSRMRGECKKAKQKKKSTWSLFGFQ